MKTKSQEVESKRIREIKVHIAILEKFWSEQPELRLGQIIVNHSEGLDPFYIEDDILLSRILNNDE